ncbi:MAG: DUF2807 domain-containing protein [Bacteroidia bacterium]|nr:DUF2807 domain-containing protein [Bacteroidia bacterium]
MRSFKSIEVQSGIDLYLTKSSTQSVEIKAKSDIIDKVITEVEGSTLKIYFERGSRWNWNNNKMSAYVSTDQIEKLSASGGSDVEAEGRFVGDEMYINGSGGSDIEMTLSCDKLVVSVSGGSDIEVEGDAKTLKIEASGGSDFKGRAFEAKIVQANVSGGSDAYFNVSEELIARASGGSDIHYRGDPKRKDIDSSSSSDVKKYRE